MACRETPRPSPEFPVPQVAGAFLGLRERQVSVHAVIGLLAYALENKLENFLTVFAHVVEPRLGGLLIANTA